MHLALDSGRGQHTSPAVGPGTSSLPAVSLGLICQTGIGRLIRGRLRASSTSPACLPRVPQRTLLAAPSTCTWPSTLARIIPPPVSPLLPSTPCPGHFHQTGPSRPVTQMSHHTTLQPSTCRVLCPQALPRLPRSVTRRPPPGLLAGMLSSLLPLVFERINTLFSVRPI